MVLYAIVKRGQNKGIVVKPHKYGDGRYHVAKTKEDIPIPANLDELDSYIGRGFGVRMGDKQLKRALLASPRSFSSMICDGRLRTTATISASSSILSISPSTRA